jgi:16S rRNA (guanine527-N7)-methyltransferase
VTSREFRDRLLERAGKADVAIAPALLESLEVYYRLLTRWNDRINLTALPLREFANPTIDRLLIEPLAAARFVPDRPLQWFDLGSGGGSPAIPLKLARPAARLAMVESKARKAAFLREAIRTLELGSAEVANARFEAVAERPELQGSADLITVRAVKVDDSLIQVAATLLGKAGQLLVFTSESVAGCAAKPPFSIAEAAPLSASPSSELLVLRRGA